jgi:hypothetical protein
MQDPPPLLRLLVGLPTPWGTLNLDVLPPGIYLSGVAPVGSR